MDSRESGPGGDRDSEAVVREMEAIARAGGKSRLYLSVDPVENVRARALYLRLGYRELSPTPRREHFRFTDSDGNLHEWREWIVDMVRDLA